MITEDAIQAAAKVLRARFNGQRVDKPWSSRDQERMYVGDARASLEAAEPHIITKQQRRYPTKPTGKPIMHFDPGCA